MQKPLPYQWVHYFRDIPHQVAAIFSIPDHC